VSGPLSLLGTMWSAWASLGPVQTLWHCLHCQLSLFRHSSLRASQALPPYPRLWAEGRFCLTRMGFEEKNPNLWGMARW